MAGLDAIAPHGKTVIITGHEAFRSKTECFKVATSVASLAHMFCGRLVQWRNDPVIMLLSPRRTVDDINPALPIAIIRNIP